VVRERCASSLRGKSSLAIMLACLIAGLVPLRQAATSAADLALVAEKAEKGVSRLSINVSAFPVATPVPGGRIAFVSYRDGNEEIYVMNSDGSGVTRLTNNLAWDRWPAWSPDGARIAFDSDRDGNYEIYVINADGTGVTRLTNNPAYDGEPSWSPDGSRIAFMSSRDGNAEIYVMNSDGTGQRNLTNNPASDAGYSWSPDSKRIAFVSTRDGSPDVGRMYVMEADGGSVMRLTDTGVGSPSWSPDGSRISFLCHRDGGWNICAMNADGTQQRNLTNIRLANGEHSWSPDGTHIAFVGDCDYDDIIDATCNIYIMSSDGTEVLRLTNNPAGYGALSRSPDGRRIAFVSDRDGNAEIYVINADGTGLMNLTNNPAGDYSPSWSPDGTEVGWHDIAPFVSDKQSLISTLASPTFDFQGIPMPSAAYEEEGSSDLLARLEETQGTGLLSVAEVSALQRLVLTEEALSDLYPSYALAADDTADGALSLLLIGLGFVRAFQEVDKNLADTPFSPIAHELSVRVTAKIVDLLNKAFQQVEYTISDPGEREAFRMMRETIWRAVQLRIVEAQDPFVDRGMTFLNAFSDVTLKPMAMEILLDRYVGQTQQIIDRAVHTADPEYSGLDKHEVHPTDERARLQMEGVIDQVEIWSEYHHETYEHFKDTADLPGMVGDLADIASMTGILAPIAQVVARVSDVMEGLLVGYGSVKSWEFLQCLESQAFDAEARIYDPSIAGGDYTGPCERAHRLGLFSLRGDEERGASLGIEAKARVEGELAEYGALVESVLEALEGEDEEELVVLIEQLLQEDEALAGEMGMMDVALAATDPEGSTELYAREMEFQLQSMVFYASLIDTLMAAGDEGELKGQAIAEGEELLDALATYEVGVEALPEVVGMEEEAGTALLAIGKVSVPELEVGEEVSIEVEVLNVGSASSREVSLKITGGEHVRISEERMHVGQLDAGEGEELVFHGEAASEGTEILMVELYEGEQYVTGEMVMAEVAPSRTEIVAPHLMIQPWLGLLCGVMGLIPLILGSGIGVWWWRRASRGVQHCRHCGTSNVTGSRYCIRCGEGLSGR